MIINDLDLGGDHPSPHTLVGQLSASALIAGKGAAAWPLGAALEHQQVAFAVTAWQGLGGAAAMTSTALRYRLRQLEELCSSPEPLFIQWAATAQAGETNITTAHDGWYVVDSGSFDYSVFEPAGWASAQLSVSREAPASPASLALWWSGAGLASMYNFGIPGVVVPNAYVAFPIGSVAPTVALSRTGAEGAIPIAAQPPAFTQQFFPNPVPFVAPATRAALFTGGCRVLDTVVAGGNAVPTAGLYLNANWVEVKGPMHDFVGDCVVTNGLLLLLFQVGVAAAPTVYLWNTKLSTQAWQQLGQIQYLDNALGGGTLREVNVERVSSEHVRVRVVCSTANGHWARLVWRLSRGHYDASVDFWPLTQSASSSLGLSWVNLQNVAKIAWTESAAVDVPVSAATAVSAGTPGFGYSALMSQTANSPLLGWLYQNPPASQGMAQSNVTFGFGDSTALAAGSFRAYGIFAVPFTTAPNLQAEAEAGSLPAGWTSVANAAASGGNEAKCASGTLAAVRNLFGTAWQPQPQNGCPADVYFRIRVTTNVGSALEFKCGLWDVTAGAYVANGSLILNRNAMQTAYGATTWVKVNTAAMVIPIGHNVQFAAEPALTLGTDWFVDEAVLAPRFSAASNLPGLGDWPADLWEQFMEPLTTAWVPG